MCIDWPSRKLGYRISGPWTLVCRPAQFEPALGEEGVAVGVLGGDAVEGPVGMGLGSMVLSFGARRLGRAFTIRSEDDGAFLYSCDGQVLAVALSALRDGDAWPMGQGSVSQEFKRAKGSAKTKAGWQAHPMALGQGIQYVIPAMRCDKFVLCSGQHWLMPDGVGRKEG